MDEEVLPAKTCRYCCEPIHARAKRCPHCRMHQSRWACALHPAVPACLMLSPLAFFVLMGVFFHHEFGPGKDFARYEGQLVAVDTRMEYDEEGEMPVVRVWGKLQNNSRVAWDYVETEVRFLDDAGRLVDVANETHTLTVPAGESRDFWISQYSHLPLERYARHEVHVRWAEEAK